MLSSHVFSYFLRAVTQGEEAHVGYVSELPVQTKYFARLRTIGSACIKLKESVVQQNPTEYSFRALPVERSKARDLSTALERATDEIDALHATLLALEGLNERWVVRSYDLTETTVNAIMKDTGSPVGWNSSISDFDQLPSGIFVQVPADLLAALEQQLTPSESGASAKLMSSRMMDYFSQKAVSIETRPGASNHPQSLEPNDPIPSESFIEDLSRALSLHPISTFWILKSLRGTRSSLLDDRSSRLVQDYVSVTIQRLLGYRWPVQDEFEKTSGPILPPHLVVEDGIIPVIGSPNKTAAIECVRARLESQFGADGLYDSERQFQRLVGTDLATWIETAFFSYHLQQFKHRPIAWHLTSPEGTFQAFVLYHKLSQLTLQKLRAQYAGEFVSRLHIEQERAKNRGDNNAVSELQLKIEDIEEFRSRIEAIERGDELKYRIRCPWKGEEKNGRPGPYAPDIDDGVKVNIRPFQESGLLAQKVIKKW